MQKREKVWQIRNIERLVKGSMFLNFTTFFSVFLHVMYPQDGCLLVKYFMKASNKEYVISDKTAQTIYRPIRVGSEQNKLISTVAFNCFDGVEHCPLFHYSLHSVHFHFQNFRSPALTSWCPGHSDGNNQQHGGHRRLD